MHSREIKNEARRLRSEGNSYREICSLLSLNLPKSTLATWCKDVPLPERYQVKSKLFREQNFALMKKAAEQTRLAKQNARALAFDTDNSRLFALYANDIDVQKTILSILHLAEGSKALKGALMFGNSDPLIVSMFVNLLRKCYKIDESKFRCTVQCRADQDASKLEAFWSETTGIPLHQFYQARIDKRSIGKSTLKNGYKGVCRINYFSSVLDLELKHIARRIMTGP